MSLLSDIKEIMDSGAVKLMAEVGVFKSAPAPRQYVVLVPIGESLDCADDAPESEIQAVRISLFSKIPYTAKAADIARACVKKGLTITDRRYIGHEDDTGYHHYVIDVESNYIWED